MMAAACQLARAKLAQYVSSLRESSTAEKAGALVKAGYLGSAKTIMRNDLGNASWGGVEYLAQRPLAVATDYLAAVMKSAASFGRVKPHEVRQMANTLDVGGLAAGARGFAEGVDRAVRFMKTGLDPERAIQKFEFNETSFKNPVLDKTVKGIYNFMEANDKPFFGFAFQTSLYGRAKLMGIREGLKGESLRSRTNEFLANPTEEMTLGAMSDAEYATFKNATALSDAAVSLRTGLRRRQLAAPPGRRLGLGALSLGLDITIPFTKVASAIANGGIDYSPAGFAKALITAADKDPKVQGQLAQQLSRATIGTGLTMLGYSMFANGTLTGSSPTNPSEREQWDIEGKQANSIKLNGRWRSITFLGPLAIPLLLGANLRKFSGSEHDEGTGSKTAFAVGSLGKTMTEQSYLQGLSNVIDAMSDPAAKGASAVAGMVPIPAIVGQVATAADPVQRQTASVADKIQARIPGASKRLAPRLTQFGDTLKKTPGGVRGAAEALLDITNPRTAKPSPLVNEMNRLQVTVPRFARRVKLRTEAGAEAERRKADDYNALVSEFGPIKRAMAEQLIESDDYKSASDEERKLALEAVLRAVHNAGNSVDKARRLGEKVPKLTVDAFK